MPRRPNPNPSYLHYGKDKARMVVYDHNGNRQFLLLPGAHGSKESLDEYHRVCGVLRANGGRLPMPKAAAADLTVAELVLKYMDHARTYYVNPETGEPTGEIECLTLAFRPLVRTYGPEPARDFDSLKLKGLQQIMATGDWLTEKEKAKKEKEHKPLGLSRTSINQRTDRIRRFTWCCAEKIVSAEVVVNLQSLAGLKRGRSQARETEIVQPVDVEVVEQTLPHLPSVPADIIRILLWSSARVGELCRVRACEIDRTGPVWLWRPQLHKGKHRGLRRTVALGPRCQLVLRKYLGDDENAPLFSPAAADTQRKAEMRANRKSKMQPSQVCRAKKNPTCRPGALYNHRSINHAIRRACLKAGVPLWHTHQLRHTAALLAEREAGLEAARR
jgi:integrase